MLWPLLTYNVTVGKRRKERLFQTKRRLVFAERSGRTRLSLPTFQLFVVGPPIPGWWIVIPPMHVIYLDTPRYWRVKRKSDSISPPPIFFCMSMASRLLCVRAFILEKVSVTPMSRSDYCVWVEWPISKSRLFAHLFCESAYLVAGHMHETMSYVF